MKRRALDPLDDREPGFKFSSASRKGAAIVICPRCKTSLSQGDLSCKVCAERKSREAYLTHQRQFMPMVFAGLLALRIRRGRAAGMASQLHIELFGDSAHTFCGVPTAGMVRTFLVFPAELRAPTDCCAGCAKVFEKLMSESEAELDAIPVDEPEAS